MRNHSIYKTQNSALALFALYFCPAKYIEMAFKHDVANNLAILSYQKAYLAGEYHPESERDKLILHCEARRNELKSSIKSSLIWAVCLSILALLVGFLIDKIDLSLPLDFKKSFLAVSGFLGIWAAALQLVKKPESFDGNTLAENIHQFIMLALFVPISIVTILAVML